MVSAMENVMSTVAQVKKAVVAKFGEKALADLTPLNMGGRPDASLNNANVQINGDHAEVFFSSSPNANSFELVKVGDQWRIAMGELFSPQEETPALVKSFEEKMNGQEQVLNEVLAALNAGKLQTVQEVREELIGPPVRQPRD